MIIVFNIILIIYETINLGFLSFCFGSVALASQREVKLKHHFRETGSATLVASKKAMAKATLVKGIIVLYHSKFIVLQYV